jgi:L-methionine (R)-S-oxide reductase
MAASILILEKGSKQERYDSILKQIESLIAGETDVVANMANISAALKYSMGFFWVGFYRVMNEQELVLGPYQGTIACTRIQKGKGVCGKAWEKNTSIVVENVDEFDGHIACSSESKSEIVIPIRNKNREVTYLLDVDSNKLSDFDAIDKKYLEQLALILEASLDE